LEMQKKTENICFMRWAGKVPGKRETNCAGVRGMPLEI